MKTYQVRCEWDTTGRWVVTVPDIPGAITQSKRLDLVDRDVAEVIELMTGEQPGSYHLHLVEHVPGVGGKLAGQARRLRDQSAALAAEASEVTSEAVEALRQQGFSYRDIGTMTGVSYQHVSQLVRT